MSYNPQAVKNMYQFYFVTDVLKASDPMPLHEFFGIGEDDIVIGLHQYNEIIFDEMTKYAETNDFESSKIIDICQLASKVFVKLLTEQMQQSQRLECEFPKVEHFRSEFITAYKAIL